LLDWLTIAPSKAFGLNSGKLEIGRPADLTILDMNIERAIDPAQFATKGRNTPFAGWMCKGWPAATFVGGELKWTEGREAE
ncbi:MAG TPA: amidohydrolase family protein, partial [Bacillaceae bacterium]